MFLPIASPDRRGAVLSVLAAKQGQDEPDLFLVGVELRIVGPYVSTDLRLESLKLFLVPCEGVRNSGEHYSARHCEGGMCRVV